MKVEENGVRRNHVNYSHTLKFCLEDFHELSPRVPPAGAELEARLHSRTRRWNCTWSLWFILYTYLLWQSWGSTIVHLCSAVMGVSVNRGVTAFAPVKHSPSPMPHPLFAMSIFGMLMCFVLTMHGC